MPDVKSASVGKHEHLYECASCGGMYLAKVSRCDCMPDVQQFNEWIAYPKQASAPAQPAEVGELAERMKDAERNEKHWNVQQTRYWCNQYKLLARAALAKLEGK